MAKHSSRASVLSEENLTSKEVQDRKRKARVLRRHIFLLLKREREEGREGERVCVWGEGGGQKRGLYKDTPLVKNIEEQVT